MKVEIRNVSKRFLGLLFAVLLASFSPQVARSQDEEKNAEFEKELESTSQLVVMLSIKFAGSPDFGSGIIVGREKDRVFIATAYHVLHRGSDHPVIGVRFKSDPNRELVAKLLKYDEALDLAVLTVEKLLTEKTNPCQLRLGRLGDVNALSRGTGVFSVGNPNGVGWATSVEPEKVVRFTENDIVFQSTFIKKGHSGGPLLNEDCLIVGMTTKDEPPFGQATSIEVVLTSIKRWGYTVQLGKVLQNGMTELHMAVVNKDAGAISKLLTDCGPDVVDDDKATPLHYAARHKNLELITLLERAGADLNALDVDGIPPLGEAIQSSNSEVAKALVKAGAKVDIHDYSALVHAAKVEQHEMVVFLLQNGARINAQPGGQETALHYAVLSNGVQTVSVLVKAGANVAIKREDGRTPLHVAVMGHDKDLPRREIITLLLKAGAKADTIDFNGNSPLHEAVVYRDLETLKQLLATGINADIRRGGFGEDDRTALHVVVADTPSRFEPEIMQALIKAGANVNARSGEKKTPLHIAVSAGNTHATEGLIQAGADVNAKDGDGETPLILAVLEAGSSRLELASMLLRARADVNVKDSKGRTALQIAKDRDFQVAALLRQYGAN
jgi:ankyrin repeat protein